MKADGWFLEIVYFTEMPTSPNKKTCQHSEITRRENGTIKWKERDLTRQEKISLKLWKGFWAVIEYIISNFRRRMKAEFLPDSKLVCEVFWITLKRSTNNSSHLIGFTCAAACKTFPNLSFCNFEFFTSTPWILEEKLVEQRSELEIQTNSPHRGNWFRKTGELSLTESRDLTIVRCCGLFFFWSEPNLRKREADQEPSFHHAHTN